MRRLGLPALLALPALCLAVAGLFHPHHLTYDTSWRWFTLHLPGLLAFPLVGVALAALVRLRTDPFAWAIRLTAYVYATFYTALDVISGVAAGYVTHELGPGVPRPDAVRLLFRIGTPLGEIGSWALLVTCALVLVDQVRRHGASGAVALVLLPGAWLVHVDHIFSPRGVLGMVLVGVGTGAVALVDATRSRSSA
ncbi:hypothetical protein [Nocardioides sp. URHA0020]|uniref:hypothetical protein n=1 Tax=Nocardioides sp. URHA0020 TaxID=1380392 RepID=UPI0006859A97|nr:hypothetical protein [Nocardioides sp. URHA0020]